REDGRMPLPIAMSHSVSPRTTLWMPAGLAPVVSTGPLPDGLPDRLPAMAVPPSSLLPSTRPRTAPAASPAVMRPSPFLSRPLFQRYSVLPLDHRVEFGSDLGEPYSTDV